MIDWDSIRLGAGTKSGEQKCILRRRNKRYEKSDGFGWEGKKIPFGDSAFGVNCYSWFLMVFDELLRTEPLTYFSLGCFANPKLWKWRMYHVVIVNICLVCIILRSRTALCNAQKHFSNCFEARLWMRIFWFLAVHLPRPLKSAVLRTYFEISFLVCTVCTITLSFVFLPAIYIRYSEILNCGVFPPVQTMYVATWRPVTAALFALRATCADHFM